MLNKAIDGDNLQQQKNIKNFGFLYMCTNVHVKKRS